MLHLLTKNLHDMIYSFWDIQHDRRKLVILGQFLPFYPTKNPKTQNFENMNNIAGNINILHICTKNHNHKIHGSLVAEWDS